jgi:hypothetical protein
MPAADWLSYVGTMTVSGWLSHVVLRDRTCSPNVPLLCLLLDRFELETE